MAQVFYLYIEYFFVSLQFLYRERNQPFAANKNGLIDEIFFLMWLGMQPSRVVREKRAQNPILHVFGRLQSS